MRFRVRWRVSRFRQKTETFDRVLVIPEAGIVRASRSTPETHDEIAIAQSRLIDISANEPRPSLRDTLRRARRWLVPILLPGFDDDDPEDDDEDEEISDDVPAPVEATRREPRAPKEPEGHVDGDPSFGEDDDPMFG